MYATTLLPDGLSVCTNTGREFRSADADAGVTLIGGALEGSNVNVVDSMVSMISLARQFELHMNVLKNAESNETKANELLNVS